MVSDPAVKNMLVAAPLYTQYVKSASEWRVHVMEGDAFDVQRKVRDKRFPADEVDWRIRNHDRGFIFQRHDLDPPAGLGAIAVSATKALSLFFGAVDIIYNAHYEQLYVLEVNCAPGLEGTTLSNYVRKFREYVR